MPFMYLRLKFTPIYVLCLLAFSRTVLAQSTEYDIRWGIHDYGGGGSSAPNDFQNLFGSPSWSSGPNDQEISELDAAGTNSSFINDGDLIELGFFDTDNDTPAEDRTSDQSSTYTPNTDVSSLFKGKWTPITSRTTVGKDYHSSNDIGDGLFWFTTKFQASTDGVIDAGEEFANINYDKTSGFISRSQDEFDGDDTENLSNANSFNEVFDRVKALHASGSDPYVGIRFYDGTSATHQTTRYNTIMNQNWKFDNTTGDGIQRWYLQSPASGAETSGIEFEFANSSYSSTLIGTGGSNAVGSSDYVATITYHDGSSALNITNSGGIGDTILSGLHNDSSGGAITVGDDNTLTINSTNGNTFDFSGDIEGASGAGASTIVKVGAGEQILTGDVNLAGSSSGWVDILEGTLTLNPDSGNTQSVEYLKNSSGTPTLKLDNTGIGTGQIVELGFANTNSVQTFSGGVTLSGNNGTSNKIKIASGATDYSKEQILSGAITGTNTLVKDGAGRLVLTGDSTTSFSGDITVDDGTLVIGDGSSDGSNLDNDNIITINKGKLEIAKSENVTLTAQGGSGKSMIGGSGTISAATIGDGANEIDYISPGRGITSSLTPSLKSTDYDASVAANSPSIGDFTVTSLTLNGGSVYDWQIDDFTGGASGAGSKYDVLKFNSLAFESGQTININIMAIKSSDGTAGAPDNVSNIGNSYADANGFLFLDSQSGNHATNGPTSAGDASSYFTLRTDDFDSQVGSWYGDWGVYYNGSGDFYLTYSAVPEPSTYIMVTRLFLLPGWRWIRRLRATAKEDDKSEA